MMLEELLAAVRYRLDRIDETRDRSLALEAQALTEAQQLTALLQEDTNIFSHSEAWYTLGWLHFYRFSALPKGQNRAALDAAVRAFTPCFLIGTYDLPELLLPLLVNTAAPHAVDLLQQALASDEPNLLSSTVNTFQRMMHVSPDHLERAVMLDNLGLALRVRFERAGVPADLDQAVSAGREAVRITPPNHPNRAGRLSNLGNTLRVRFERAGVPADLDQAVSAGREAVRITPPNHPNRAGRLSNLGNTLRVRFERAGVPADLDQAVSAGQEAVRITPPNHPERAGMLSNLGLALRIRFERMEGLADLDQAVTAGQEAVRITPPNDPERAGRLSNLGGALRVRFERAGVPADLDQAVSAGQEAVRITPPNDPERAGMLSNLGAAFQVRFERAGVPADLDQAVSAGQEAVRITPPNHPERAGMLSNLGLALRIRFERMEGLADLDQAISAGQEAVRITPPNYPERAVMLSNLGLALQDRFKQTRRRSDLHAAASAFIDAWDVVSAQPSVRIQAARGAARLTAKSRAKQAADLAEAAVLLLPEVTLRHLGRGDQQHALGSFAGLSGEAASLALANPCGTQQDRATRALQLLEAGRAVLLSQALDTRSDLTDLHEQRPDLATRLVELRDQLDQPTRPTVPISESDGLGTSAGRKERAAQDRYRLAGDFAQTVAEIRGLDGFASFGQPPSAQELLAQAEEGPVVVFNVSRYRSDALILTRDGITYLTLPELTWEALTERITLFRQAVHTVSTSKDRVQRVQAQAAITEVMHWLWETATGPVLKKLGYCNQPSADADWPRVWWAPGGLLGLLPLHAAGYHSDSADDPHRRTVMDRVVSSYTPTIRALRYARQQLRTSSQQADTDAQALIVAMPTTPGVAIPLSYVTGEVEKVLRHLPHAVLLQGPDPDRPDTVPPRSVPTRAAVLRNLPACSIAHFACHGASHPTDPSQSLLLLHDHDSDPFTVSSLAPVRLDCAQLAYLSACRTAAIETSDLVDEAIHLASAFQLAGFRHVVATLWEIRDEIAVDVADAFYTNLRGPDGTLDMNRAAQALHQAVRSVRDGQDLPGLIHQSRPSYLWAGYLHAGA